MLCDSTFKRPSKCAIPYLCKQSRTWLQTMQINANLFKYNYGNVNKCYMPMQRVQWHNYLQYLFQTSAAFARKKCHIISANCAKSVSIKESLPLRMHICMCIYIYICVCVVLKVNSFLANLCSIPPRKFNMSLQQIPMVVLLQQSVPPSYTTCF